MSHVLLVENDAQFSAQVKAALEQRQLSVVVAPDGDAALQSVGQGRPQMILLAVELPRVNGYSICNKLKKNTDLAGIPIILMSSQATPEIFDQHRRLKKYRAEEYLFKPIAVDELMEKIAPWLPIAAPASTGNVHLDTTARSVAATPAGSLMGGDDSDFDAAFDALQMEGDGPSDAPVLITAKDPIAEAPVAEFDSDDNFDVDAATNLEAVVEADDDDIELDIDMSGGDSAPEIVLDDGLVIESEDEPAVADPGPGAAVPIEVVDSQPAIEPLAAAPADSQPAVEALPPIEPVEEDRVGAGTAPDLEAAAVELQAEAPAAAESAADIPISMTPVEEPVQPVGEVATVATEAAAIPLSPLDDAADAAAAINAQDTNLSEVPLEPPADDNEESVDNLKREVRRLTGALESSKAGYSRDREILSLREDIVTKDKKIYDLEDSLATKERQILDNKDRMRDLDRKVSGAESKLLLIEKDLVTAREKMAALERDKATLVEREAGVKLRLEQAKQEITKAYEEIDQLKEQLTREVEAAKAAGAEAVQTAQAAAQQELAAAAEQHQQALSAAQSSHEDQLSALKAEHTQALDAQKQQAADQVRAAEESAEAAAEAAKRDLEQRLGERDSQHQSAVSALNTEHEQAIEALRGEHARAVAEANDAHTGELNRLREQQQIELEQRAQEAKGREEQLREQHKVAVGENEARFASEKEALRAELDKKRAAERAELEGAISEREDAIADLQADMQQARQAIADRDGQIDQLNVQAGEFRDQLAVAANKVAAKDHAADRAKRAMAVAIALLDAEPNGAPAEDASSMEDPAAAPAE